MLSVIFFMEIPYVITVCIDVSINFVEASIKFMLRDEEIKLSENFMNG